MKLTERYVSTVHLEPYLLRKEGLSALVALQARALLLIVNARFAVEVIMKKMESARPVPLELLLMQQELLGSQRVFPAFLDLSRNMVGRKSVRSAKQVRLKLIELLAQSVPLVPLQEMKRHVLSVQLGPSQLEAR